MIVKHRCNGKNNVEVISLIAELALDTSKTATTHKLATHMVVPPLCAHSVENGDLVDRVCARSLMVAVC